MKSQTKCSYTHIILDEIHERSTEIDYTLFITRKLAVTFPHLKIILVSATLQGNLFIEYFRKELGHDKVADPYFVGIKRFPVKVVHIDQLDELVSSREDEKQHVAMAELQRLARKLENNAPKVLPHAPTVTTFTEEVCMNLIISQPSPGDAVLIFHSGLSDINDFCNHLHNKLQRLGVQNRYRLFIFHPQLQRVDQNEAFLEPSEGTANIIVANHGSESSLTIPNLRLVINFGINKEMMYNSAKRISELTRQWCSHASCIQREGRVGRVSEGTAVHLFTKEFYETLPDFGPPEIIRIPLAKTFLRAKEIGPLLGIPLPSHLLSMVIEPPSFVQFSTALHDLAEYGAIAHNPQHKISEEADVTLLGKFSLSLPLDLSLCRLVLLGILFGCPLDGIVIAAAIAMYQDVFSMPMKVVMNDLHQFCHSLTTSTFSRMRYDDGCYSNLIMILNMFIDWLKYKSNDPRANRRGLASKFSSKNAINSKRLLHLEEFVGDIARCVATCIPKDSVLYSELQTLSKISKEMKEVPVVCDTDLFVYEKPPSLSAKYIPPHLRNLKSLHFCSNHVILKALITASAPDEILCGERVCESSHPYMKSFANKCISVIENEEFPLKSTLCMDLSKLDEVDTSENETQDTDETAFEKLFSNLSRDYQLHVETKVVEDVAVLHFLPNTSSALTKTAHSEETNSSTADISQIPPEVDFFWRFGEQNILWDVDLADSLFPPPSHPCALMWHRFDESKSKVNTAKMNFRNPTGFICQYDKPSQPYFAVATGAFASLAGSILAPRLTVLPNMPTSLLMVLAFQLPTSAVEFLINKKTIKAIKINSVEIPCTDIQNYISSIEIVAINQVRNAVSNVMTLPLSIGCIPLSNSAIAKIPKLLHDLLNVSQSKAANTKTPSMVDTIQGLVWELVTPGKCTEDPSTSVFSHYPQFKCSLVGTKPYAVEKVCHDHEQPLSPFSIEYTQSVSAKLLAESRRIHDQFPELLEKNVTASSDVENGAKTTKCLAENTKWRSAANTENATIGISEEKGWTAGTSKAVVRQKALQHEQLKEMTTKVKPDKRSHSKLGSEPDSRHVIAEQCLVKLQQEVIRHLQRNDKMEFLSELKAQRRIKHLCRSIGINLDVNFFYKWPELFEIGEVEEDEEGSDAAVTEKEYLIILDPSKWKDVVEDEGPVLPTSVQLLQAASNLAAREKKKTHMGKAEEETEATQREEQEIHNKKKANMIEKEKVKEKEATLSEMEGVGKADLREENERREKKKRKKERQKEKKRAEKEAFLAGQIATTSKHTSQTQFGMTEPQREVQETVSQIPPINGDCKQTLAKLQAVSKERKLLEEVDPTVPDERKETDPETPIKIKISENGKNSLKETPVCGSSSSKQNTASDVASKNISAQPGTGEHIAQFFVDFISKHGGQSTLETLTEKAFLQYQEKYYEQYTYVGKEFLRKYDSFEIFEDSSGVCHVRVVGAQRSSLESSETEKMELKTEKETKSLSSKS